MRVANLVIFQRLCNSLAPLMRFHTLYCHPQLVVLTSITVPTKWYKAAHYHRTQRPRKDSKDLMMIRIKPVPIAHSL